MTSIRYDGVKYLYKFTLSGGRSLLGDIAFHLPHGGEPGAWMPETIHFGTLDRHGYYGLLENNLVDWTGPELWLIESAGGWRPAADGDKMICAKARLAARVTAWDRAAMIAFACDAAERALPAYDALNPGDGRLRAALAAVRVFLADRSKPESLRAAVAEAEEAATTAAAVSRKTRCVKNTCDDNFLDAARATKVVADMARAVVDIKPNVFRPFLIRADSPAERAWQLQRKLAYIAGQV